METLRKFDKLNPNIWPHCRFNLVCLERFPKYYRFISRIHLAKSPFSNHVNSSRTAPHFATCFCYILATEFSLVTKVFKHSTGIWPHFVLYKHLQLWGLPLRIASLPLTFIMKCCGGKKTLYCQPSTFFICLSYLYTHTHMYKHSVHCLTYFWLAFLCVFICFSLSLCNIWINY